MLDRVGKWLGERDAGLDVLCDWPKEELIGKTVEEKRIILAARILARIDGGREAVEEATRRIPVLSPHYDFCCDLLDAMPTEEGRSE